MLTVYEILQVLSDQIEAVATGQPNEADKISKLIGRHISEQKVILQYLKLMGKIKKPIPFFELSYGEEIGELKKKYALLQDENQQYRDMMPKKLKSIKTNEFLRLESGADPQLAPDSQTD